MLVTRSSTCYAYIVCSSEAVIITWARSQLVHTSTAMRRVCIGMKTNGADDRIGCCFSLVNSGQPASLKCASQNRFKKCTFCSRAKLRNSKCKVLLRLLSQLAEPYRAVALSRCSSDIQRRYSSGGTDSCVGIDGVRCGFRKINNKHTCARRVQLRHRGRRCVFCDVRALRRQCRDRRSRNSLMKRLSRCNYKMAEHCIWTRVPEAYRVEFATAVLYNEAKKKFDSGVDDASVYETVPVDVMDQWASESRKKTCNDVGLHLTEKDKQRISPDSLQISEFLQAHGNCHKRKRHASLTPSRDMSMSEKRWVLEHRSKVFIERGSNSVSKEDYATWHVQGLCEDNGLKDGHSPDALRRLCLQYDEWIRKGRCTTRS